MPADDGALLPEDRETPRESACLNRLKASLLSRPGPPDETRLEPVEDGVRPLDPALVGSSSECENCHPDDDPVKMTGWQSCPAATMVPSDAKVNARYGSDGHRTERWAAGGSPGPAG